MSKCNSCGAELAPGAVFCNMCGSKVTTNSETVQSVPNFEQQATNFGQQASQPQQATNFGQPAPQPQQATNFGQPAPQPQQATNFGQPAPQPQQATNFGQQATNFNQQATNFGQQPQQAQYYGQGVQYAQPKKNTGLIAGIVAAGLVVLIALLVFLINPFASYKDPIRTLEKGIKKCDAEKIIKAFPIDSSLAALIKGNMAKEMLDDVDANNNCNIEILDAEKMTSAELYLIEKNNQFTKSMGIEYDLKAGYKVKAEMTMFEDGELETEKVEFTVCKWKGKWYIFDWDD